MFRMRNLNKIIRMFALLGFITGVFSYGVVVGTYKVFPYQQLPFMKTVIPTDDGPALDDTPVATPWILCSKHWMIKTVKTIVTHTNQQTPLI